jgi:hypothetical protein
VIDWSKEIQFIPDPSVFWGDGRCTIPIKYQALDPRLVKACEYLTIADNYLNQQDLEKCRYWTERANKESSKVFGPGYGWATPEDDSAFDYINACYGDDGGQPFYEIVDLTS